MATWGFNGSDSGLKLLRIKPQRPFEIVLALEVFDPIADKPRSLPAGPIVSLYKDGESFESVTVGDKGIAHFPEKLRPQAAYEIVIDFAIRELIHLDKDELVPATEVKSGDPRRLIRLPDKWRSTEQQSFSDDRGGAFREGRLQQPEPGTLGTQESPWRLQIDHAWPKLHVAFKYYNVYAKKEEGLPGGLLVEGFAGDAFSKEDLAAAGTILDAKGTVYLAAYKPGCALANLQLGFKADPDTFLRLDIQEIVKVSPAELETYPIPTRHILYRLPTIWASPNQRATWYGEARKTEAFLADKKTETRMDRPLELRLDDFVLTDKDLEPIDWNDNERVAVFDRLMAVRKPDSAEPYLTENNPKLTENLFPAESYYFQGNQGPERITRVIRLKDKFYDLTDRRTYQGDIIGVRAAVVDDHPWQNRKGPLISGVGNFDLHYFHDCHVDTEGNPLAHLLVYWCAKCTQEAGASPNNIVNFKRHGFLRAKERHEGRYRTAAGGPGGKNYYFKPCSSQGSSSLQNGRTVRTTFHFAAREDDPYHCEIKVYGKVRDWMSQTVANFSANSFEASNVIVERDLLDNLEYEFFTMGHELGHACGLCDEYLEPVAEPVTGTKDWHQPILPAFNQAKHSLLQYAIEGGKSLMHNAAIPRMRHHWHLADWLNHHADVQRQVGDQKFGIEYPIHSNLSLWYFLEDKYRYYHKTAKPEGIAFSNPPTGKMDLLLYKIGQDETQAFNIKPTAEGFDSILVVRIKLHYAFPLNAERRGIAAWQDKVLEMRDFQTAIDQHLGRVRSSDPLFALESGAGDFRKCCVFFLPCFDCSESMPKDSHFAVQVRPQAANAANNGTDLDSCTESFVTAARVAHAFAPDSSITNVVQVLDTTDAISLFRYTLGLAAVNDNGAPIQTIGLADLEFLKRWMEEKCLTPYIVRQY